jgi:hypothetical protein
MDDYIYIIGDDSFGIIAKMYDEVYVKDVIKRRPNIKCLKIKETKEVVDMLEDISDECVCYDDLYESMGYDLEYLEDIVVLLPNENDEFLNGVCDLIDTVTYDIYMLDKIIKYFRFSKKEKKILKIFYKFIKDKLSTIENSGLDIEIMDLRKMARLYLELFYGKPPDNQNIHL